MARGRHATPAAERAEVQVNEQALQQAGRALAVVGTELQQLQQHLGLHSMEPEILVAEAQLWMDHSARAMFEVGVRLIALRATCLRGEWLPLLERVGVAERTAQRMMQASAKCIGQQGKREKLLQLDRGKVVELVSLDDETLDAFEATGKLKLPGLTEQLALDLDEIDRMSVSELRRKLREAEHTIAAKDKLVAKKDAKLNEVLEQLEQPFKPSEESAARTAHEAALLAQLRDLVSESEARLVQLANVVQVANDPSAMPEAMRLAAATAMQYLAQRVADICATHGIEVDLEEAVVPEWVKGAQAKGKRGARAGH